MIEQFITELMNNAGYSIHYNNNRDKKLIDSKEIFN